MDFSQLCAKESFCGSLIVSDRTKQHCSFEQSHEIMYSFSCQVLVHDVTAGDEFTAVWQSAVLLLDHGKIQLQ